MTDAYAEQLADRILARLEPIIAEHVAKIEKERDALKAELVATAEQLHESNRRINRWVTVAEELFETCTWEEVRAVENKFRTLAKLGEK